ncbi:MAG: tetratricopeptide repeat protein [Calditerrivibrio sp.]|nr:tetratricopeptide repeat protein [Calditerrivibrio sp.]
MKKFCIIFLAFFLIFACSRKEEPKSRDNITSKRAVAPIAESESIKIDEGNRYFLNGNFEKAIEFYTKGLQENRALAFYNLGVANYLLGRYKQSEEYFREAIKEKNDFKDAYINLSATLLKLKKYDEAAQVISSIEPSNAKEYQIAAEIYSILNDSPRAYYYYEKFSKFKDALPSGFINYGLFLKNIGEEEKGNAIINKTIQKIESMETKEYEEYFQLASAYFSIKNYEKSLYYAKIGLNMKKTYEILELMMKIYEIQGRFDLASIAAENMLSINVDESTYVNYIKNLIKSANYTVAEETLKEALTKYPKYDEFFKLYHNFAILIGDLVKANLIAKKGYEVINNDDMGYFYAKHSILYDNNFENAKKLIGTIKSSDLKNILDAMLMIKLNNLSGAEEKLKNVSDKNHFDYNFADTFIKLSKKEYKDAEISVEKMDDVVEKFFYKFIIYFNTKQFEKLADLAKSNALFVKNIKRYPKVSFNIVPTFEDLEFSFEFYGDFESILRLILTPIFIDPEEMTNYLATGYSLLKQSDQLLALTELKKSLNLSNGIKHNNNGVKAILNFDYVTGNRELAEAVNYLGDNPIVYYNIGILMLNLGNISKAYEFFDNALLNNKFIFPAYLGKAVCLSLMNEKNRVSAQYDMLISNYNVLENSEKKQALPYYYTKLLSMVGSKKYGEVKDAVRDSDPELHKSIKELALAIQGNNFEKFTSLNLVFHRSDTLKSLLNLYYKNVTPEKFPKHDRVSDYMIYNTSLRKGGLSYKIFNHEIDKYLEIENLKYSILFGESNILNKLKKIATIDKNDPNLFKLSLYYFTLKRDIINAEISLQNLKKSNMDKTSLYYQMLYHFVTNNNFNINKSISKYIEVASNDYRGYMVELLKGFRENNLQTAYDNAIRLSKAGLQDKKIPLEIVINGL